MNSSWLICLTMTSSVGVNTGSSLVKSWSKLFTSRFVFYTGEKTGRERETERDRDRDRQRQRETERERERETERERERERERKENRRIDTQKHDKVEWRTVTAVKV